MPLIQKQINALITKTEDLPKHIYDNSEKDSYPSLSLVLKSITTVPRYIVITKRWIVIPTGTPTVARANGSDTIPPPIMLPMYDKAASFTVNLSLSSALV